MTELTKKDTKMMQGLSVLAMVWLHLFDKNYEGLFTPLLFVQGTPLSFYVAQLCDFCVFGFAFCSGYGHMCQFGEKNFFKKRLKNLLSVLVCYWTVLITFTAISAAVGKADFMPGSFKTFVSAFFIYESPYNGAWWYMSTYVVLILISPFMLKFIKKTPTVLVGIIGFAIYGSAYAFRFWIATDNWILLKYGPFGTTLFEYMIAAVCVKHSIFSKIGSLWKRQKKGIRIGFAVIILSAMLYARTKIVPSLFVAPCTGLVILFLFYAWEKPAFVEKFFDFIGTHSTHIWLTHMFFYSKLFIDFVYVAKYPILVYVLMLTITIALSKLLQKLEQPINVCLSKFKFPEVLS